MSSSYTLRQTRVRVLSYWMYWWRCMRGRIASHQTMGWTWPQPAFPGLVCQKSYSKTPLAACSKRIFVIHFPNAKRIGRLRNHLIISMTEEGEKHEDTKPNIFVATQISNTFCCLSAFRIVSFRHFSNKMGWKGNQKVEHVM